MIFVSSDGLRIHCKSYLCEKPRADILVLHGMGEHSARYEEFAAQVNKIGFNCHTMDWRGHGCSEGLTGHVHEFAQFHRDLEYWKNFLDGNALLDADRPLFLFGHSMGGLIALDFLLHYRDAFSNSLHGVSISSPALGILNPLATFKPFFDLKFPGAMEQIHFPSGIKSEQLSHDKAKVAEHEDDPLVHNKITIGMFRAMLNAVERVIRTKSSLALPVQILYAGEDSIVDSEATQKFAKNLKAEDKEVHEFRGFYHEIYNEKKRADVYAKLLDWLERCLDPQKARKTPKKNAKGSAKSSAKKATAKVISRSRPAKKARSISI